MLIANGRCSPGVFRPTGNRLTAEDGLKALPDAIAWRDGVDLAQAIAAVERS
ncbi:hypothetical protein [uncultured Alsobacter sp.]|uniref:hypothetical protein n=1 Tax=uncultured Alsobacter sp. TaxID=1748258 RepID=UPI0025FF86D6|nr:hypothetical protein [uncultured Alsobacter sp.]